MNTPTPPYRFRVYPDAAGNWRWRLLSHNGRRIASSGEAFDSRENAVRAAKLVRRVAGTAPIKIAPSQVRRVA